MGTLFKSPSCRSTADRLLLEDGSGVGVDSLEMQKGWRCILNHNSFGLCWKVRSSNRQLLSQKNTTPIITSLSHTKASTITTSSSQDTRGYIVHIVLSLPPTTDTKAAPASAHSAASKHRRLSQFLPSVFCASTTRECMLVALQQLR